MSDEFLAVLFPNNKLCTPSPSVTWNVARATHLPCGVEQRLLIDDLHRKGLSALKSCAQNSVPWCALESSRHPHYRVHFDEMPDQIDQWRIEILPYGGPCYHSVSLI